jgi:hypothetical protein
VDELEELLQQYRPVGPPSDLRDRITLRGSAGDGHASSRGWLLVAATLLCAILFYTLAAREHRQIATRLPAPAEEVAAEPSMEPWP